MVSFELLEKIGFGSYSSVFRCKINNKDFAYKIYKKKFFDSFIKEVAFLTYLNHPNIIKLYFTQPSMIYDYVAFAMELSQLNLRELLNSQYLNSSSRKHIAHQILCGIEYMHSKKIIHRDLKPENLLLFPNGDVKIIDFNLAVMNYGQSLNHDVQSPAYRAPEVIQKKKYSYPIDMWSFGIILYRMTTYTSLFNTDDSEQLLKQQKNICTKRNGNKVINLSNDKSLEDLINRCLELDPEKRITAKQALDHPYFNEWVLPKITNNSLLVIAKPETTRQIRNIFVDEIEDYVVYIAEFILESYKSKKVNYGNLEILLSCYFAIMITMDYKAFDVKKNIIDNSGTFNDIIAKMFKVLHNRFIP